MILSPEEILTLEAWNLRFTAELHAAIAREHELAGRRKESLISAAKSREYLRMAHRFDPATQAEAVPCFCCSS